MKYLTSRLLTLFVVCSFFGISAVRAQESFELLERSEIVPVLSDCWVAFDLLTDGDVQFAAFYDAERNMTVARRRLDETAWTVKRLPTKIGVDSHNYVTMALDADKCLHVSGNMHCVPLIYFRADKPYDIESLKPVPEMVGTEEKRCTYPKFLSGPNNELLFNYRDGYSGAGNQIWNVYDSSQKTWKRLLDRPLFDGRKKMNAYIHGPVLGSDGFYHMSWMWRDSPDCRTNHDLSYARSRDLKSWETSRGEALKLPITIDNGEIVDPVPPGGGLLNTIQYIGFDLQKRVVISYGKYDADGNFQLYQRRLEDGTWKPYQTTKWNYRWDFQGRGSLVREIQFSPVEIENGKLVQWYEHIKNGSGYWQLDEKTLQPIGHVSWQNRWPKELDATELDFPGIGNRIAWDRRDEGRPHLAKADVRYAMRWEALPANRDQAHSKTPPPAMLRVFKLKAR